MVKHQNIDADTHLDDLLKPSDAAEILNVSDIWLKKQRLAGAGPKFVRLSERLIRYRRSDLIAWVEMRC